MNKKLMFWCLGFSLIAISVQAEMMDKTELRKYLTDHKCQITRQNSIKVIIGEELEDLVEQSYGTGPDGNSVFYGYLTIPMGEGEALTMNMKKEDKNLKLKFSSDLQSLSYSTSQERIVPANRFWIITLGDLINQNRFLSCNE